MNLEFINNLHDISKKQIQLAFEAAVLMATATSAFYVFYGNVFGINRMIGSMLKESFSQSSRVKLTLISGLIFFSALIKTLYRQHLTTFDPFDSFSYTQSTSALRLIISGALIGFGSQYASIGTTTQFGFQGIPYFNIKSLLSGIILLVVASLTHTYKLFEYLPNTPRIINLDLPDNISYNAYLLVFLLIPFICFVISKTKSLKTLISYISLFCIGLLMAYSMMVAGFTERKIVYGFFKLDKSWDPKMLVIYGYGLAIHLIVVLVMQFIIKKPLFNREISPQNDGLRLNLVIGTIIYGIGLGLGGLNPITVLLQLPLQSIKIGFYWGIPCIIGMKTAHKLFQPKVQQTPIQKNQ